MRNFVKCLAAAALLLLTQCVATQPSTTGTSQRPTARIGTEAETGPATAKLNGGCPLDKLQWLEAAKQYDQEKQRSLASQLAQAAQADAATLDRMASSGNNNTLAMDSELKGLVEKLAANGKVPVSDGFYKEYLSSRMAMCAVMDALRNGSIKKDETSKVASTTFKNIAKSFQGMAN
ncbi:hypothetical protein GCM10027275_37560 [Rhabdobacter roseus]|uniref:Lipoprotein n=1 Tax=Rhabdobacter roseus TaxID=1655419 RepID=A0A840TSH4_9BACT|nr:hypothetical protein [Rhabdobacter roseus]MBB5285835.1 hypothetical protein [Rhabdobacter roseus]